MPNVNNGTSSNELEGVLSNLRLVSMILVMVEVSSFNKTE